MIQSSQHTQSLTQGQSLRDQVSFIRLLNNIYVTNGVNYKQVYDHYMKQFQELFGKIIKEEREQKERNYLVRCIYKYISDQVKISFTQYQKHGSEKYKLLIEFYIHMIINIVICYVEINKVSQKIQKYGKDLIKKHKINPPLGKYQQYQHEYCYLILYDISLKELLQEIKELQLKYQFKQLLELISFVELRLKKSQMQQNLLQIVKDIQTSREYLSKYSKYNVISVYIIFKNIVEHGESSDELDQMFGNVLSNIQSAAQRLLNTNYDKLLNTEMLTQYMNQDLFVSYIYGKKYDNTSYKNFYMGVSTAIGTKVITSRYLDMLKVYYLQLQEELLVQPYKIDTFFELIQKMFEKIKKIPKDKPILDKYKYIAEINNFLLKQKNKEQHIESFISILCVSRKLQNTFYNFNKDFYLQLLENPISINDSFLSIAMLKKHLDLYNRVYANGPLSISKNAKQMFNDAISDYKSISKDAMALFNENFDQELSNSPEDIQIDDLLKEEDLNSDVEDQMQSFEEQLIQEHELLQQDAQNISEDEKKEVIEEKQEEELGIQDLADVNILEIDTKAQEDQQLSENEQLEAVDDKHVVEEAKSEKELNQIEQVQETDIQDVQNEEIDQQNAEKAEEQHDAEEIQENERRIDQQEEQKEEQQYLESIDQAQEQNQVQQEQLEVQETVEEEQREQEIHEEHHEIEEKEEEDQEENQEELQSYVDLGNKDSTKESKQLQERINKETEENSENLEEPEKSEEEQKHEEETQQNQEEDTQDPQVEVKDNNNLVVSQIDHIPAQNPSEVDEDHQDAKFNLSGDMGSKIEDVDNNQEIGDNDSQAQATLIDPNDEQEKDAQDETESAENVQIDIPPYELFIDISKWKVFAKISVSKAQISSLQTLLVIFLWKILQIDQELHERLQNKQKIFISGVKQQIFFDLKVSLDVFAAYKLLRKDNGKQLEEIMAQIVPKPQEQSQFICQKCQNDATLQLLGLQIVPLCEQHKMVNAIDIGEAASLLLAPIIPCQKSFLQENQVDIVQHILNINNSMQKYILPQYSVKSGDFIQKIKWDVVDFVSCSICEQKMSLALLLFITEPEIVNYLFNIKQQTERIDILNKLQSIYSDKQYINTLKMYNVYAANKIYMWYKFFNQEVAQAQDNECIEVNKLSTKLQGDLFNQIMQNKGKKLNPKITFCTNCLKLIDVGEQGYHKRVCEVCKTFLEELSITLQ